MNCEIIALGASELFRGDSTARIGQRGLHRLDVVIVMVICSS
jgi:hypothetical protein